MPLLEYLGRLAGGLEREPPRLVWPFGLLQKGGQGPHRPREVHDRLRQQWRDGVPTHEGVGRTARQDPRVDDGQVYPGARVGVELEVLEGPAAGRGEPGGLVAGGQRLVEVRHPVVVDRPGARSTPSWSPPLSAAAISSSTAASSSKTGRAARSTRRSGFMGKR